MKWGTQFKVTLNDEKGCTCAKVAAARDLKFPVVGPFASRRVIVCFLVRLGELFFKEKKEEVVI